MAGLGLALYSRLSGYYFYYYGILGLLLCLGLMQYLIRMGNSGRLDGPADVAMRSRWRAKHHSTRVATLPVHTPKRAAGAQWPKGAAFA